ncbi:MAG: D-glycero-D-manno-heptose 1,7-bisphosphate phosphatase [Chloroflexota bacterium]|nr:D-glycero-D-manno-heptose 1,7-bisphosphate phosphatase [Chloroflexota bacterium]
MGSYSAYFFDLGGTLLALDDDEIARDGAGRVRLLPGVAERLASLQGQRVYVVSNQSGVARGTLSIADARGFVEQVNAQADRVIADYRICTHEPDAGCVCRKPAPGLVLFLASAHELDLASAVMVGDSLADERCARNAGIGTFIWADEFFGTLAPRTAHDLILATA